MASAIIFLSSSLNRVISLLSMMCLTYHLFRSRQRGANLQRGLQ